MNQLLDLCLTLTPPPADAPAGTVAHVELRCDALGLQPFARQLLSDPLSPAEREELTWYLEHYWQWPYEEFARRGQHVEQLLVDAGKRLYDAVFGSAQNIVLTACQSAKGAADDLFSSVAARLIRSGVDAVVAMSASVLVVSAARYTGDYDPRDTDAALGKLSPALRARPTLIIADNLESILPGGEAPLDAAARAQLWDVMLRLSASGAGVIITSRDAVFGDGRMTHGKEVKHLELGGLHPEDGYALAVQLFKDLDIPQSRAPYPKLRDLLVQLDHHPLAIQLVLPALGEAGMTIDRISNEFAALLPHFSDDRETGHNRSLWSRYAACYHAVANSLYREDLLNPQAVRELARRERRNLRRALEWLLDGGALDQAAEMEDRIAHFLNLFGLWRERDELRRRVDQTVAAAGQRTGGALTWAKFLRESGAGEDEFARGNLRAAYARFTALRERIEALPAGAPIGPGSYGHCLTLGRLARCLGERGQTSVAETLMRRALEMIEALLAAQPENQNYIRERGVRLIDLGNVLAAQGKYAAAQAEYQAGLEIFERLGETQSQGVGLQLLGSLAFRQRDYDAARQRYRDALQLFQKLDEPVKEAVHWHQLGMVAEEQSDWAEAERCYRASLEIKEREGDAAGSARTCNQLPTSPKIPADPPRQKAGTGGR